MRFGSVCSGIEAASVAWGPLGWQAAWFSEIEPFPSAVLAHHYPETPNLGDMTRIPALLEAGEVEAPDILCGGTPCQAFSVAGLRRSLDDARGNLSLTFCEIANAIDNARKQPCIVFWENVPGVLSTKDNAFGCFLAGLAGEDEALVPPGGRWTDAGFVDGPQRAVAWRTLDAQYFGLAQRRRRVFVVASARKGFDPAAVLLEWEGVRRDSAPSRETREAVTPTIDASFGRLQGCSGQDANHGHGHLISMCLNAKGGAGRLDAESETLIPTIGGGFDVTHSLRGEGFDASEDGTGRGTPLVPVVSEAGDIASTLRTGGNDHADVYNTVAVAHAFDARQSDVIQYGDKTGPLDTDGHSVAVAVRTANTSANGHGISAELAHTLDQAQGQAVVQVPMVNMQGSKGNAVAQADGPSFTLNAMHGHDVHAVLAPTLTASNDPSRSPQSSEITAQVAAVVQAIAFDTYNQTVTGDTTQTLCSRGDSPGGNAHLVPTVVQATAFQERGREHGRELEIGGDVAYALTAPNGGGRAQERNVMTPAMQVRRLTPVECERLQGFPDNYTAISWRGKPAAECPDGPRYKALGNSWAVPVVRWIGRRIADALA